MARYRSGQHAADNTVTGLRKCSLDSEALCKPLSDRIYMNASGGACVHQAHGLSLVYHHPVASLISCLFGSCAPSAIFRLIPLAVVYPVNRVLQAGALANVCEKVLKNLPSLTNINSSCSVLFKAGGLLVCATLNHRLPRVILWAAVHSMPGATPRRLFAHKATARLCVATSCLNSMDDDLVAAIAPKKPIVVAGSFLMEPDGYKAIVSLAGHHWRSFFHLGNPSLLMGRI